VQPTIGRRTDNSPSFAVNAGSAYVYDLGSMTLTTPIAILNNPTPANSDYFGTSVAVSGNYVVVGAHQDDTGATDAGSVFVYNLESMTSTTPIATLNNPTPAISDYFGYSVSVSGNIVVVGAWQDDMGAIDAGTAYVYDLNSITPTTPIATLNNPTPATGENFGSQRPCRAATWWWERTETPQVRLTPARPTFTTSAR
jgi:FG-GAP repeat